MYRTIFEYDRRTDVAKDYLALTEELINECNKNVWVDALKPPPKPIVEHVGMVV